MTLFAIQVFLDHLLSRKRLKTKTLQNILLKELAL
ncbi:hypothetical protein SPPR111872_25340 [Sphingobacterium prati]